MKPSICIIGPAHPLRGGGITSFNERLARQFQREGHETIIYSFSLQYPSFLFPGSTQYSTEEAPADLDIRTCINSMNPLSWISVGREIRKRRYDIVVVRYWLPFMGPCLGTILRWIRGNKHTRIICIADNIIPHEKRIGDTLFTRYFLPSVDAFITMSDKVMADAKQLTHKPVQRVDHPLYDHFGEALSQFDARQVLGLPSDKKILLFFGFIRKYKGVDLLIEAMHTLKERGWLQDEKLLCLIAGEFYDEQAPYFEQVKKYKLEPDVQFHSSFIADSQIRYFMSAADVVIQPYKHATQSGVTPLAYHFEKPMIVTRVGGLPEMVPESVGRIAEPNAISLANTIADFFSLDLQQLSRNIHEEKKKYGWDKITAAILSLSEQNKL